MSDWTILNSFTNKRTDQKPRQQWRSFLLPLSSSPIRLKQILDKSLRWGRWFPAGSAMVSSVMSTHETA
ncbi:hypothetical protein SynA15127_02179 [Synechococcus sp. A15-127]|nr:hypothetical protein SynA15127_02179 [Synechococcus sp. A15-127]